MVNNSLFGRQQSQLAVTELQLEAECRSGSLGHVSRDFLLQTLGEAVVEEEELSVRKQAAEQSIDTVAPQQDLQGERR